MEKINNNNLAFIVGDIVVFNREARKIWDNNAKERHFVKRANHYKIKRIVDSYIVRNDYRQILEIEGIDTNTQKILDNYISVIDDKTSCFGNFRFDLIEESMNILTPEKEESLNEITLINICLHMWDTAIEDLVVDEEVLNEVLKDHPNIISYDYRNNASIICTIEQLGGDNRDYQLSYLERNATQLLKKFNEVILENPTDGNK